MSPEAIAETPADVPADVPAYVPAEVPGALPASAAAGSAPTSAHGGVLGGRDRIDAVDAQIVELIQHRIEVSRQIQAARLADGGRRVDLRRETEIISRYTVGLGRPGTTIAMALLELGRGRA